MKIAIKKSFIGLFAAMVLAFAAVLTPLTPATDVSAAPCPTGVKSTAAKPCTPAASCDSTNLNAQSGINCAQGEDTPASLFGAGSIFTTVVNIMLFIIGALSVIMLIYGGIRYTTSAGDSGAVTSAKNTIMYAIIGLVVAFLAFAVVNWVLGSVSTSV